MATLRLATLAHPLLLLCLSFIALVDAQTVYLPKNPQVIFDGASSSTSATAAAASYTGSAAYNPTTLNRPPLPNPLPPTQFTLQLLSGGMGNLSIPQAGNFMGFSIEMSVATQVLGKNSSNINVPMLNLLANVVERAGSVQVRVGGNTQESAELKQSLPNNTILAKDTANLFNPTGTPPIEYTPDLLYMMANISKFTNVNWYLGIPFFNTTPFDLSIVEYGEAILGDRLLGYQAGNEPDLYAAPPRTHRPTGYSPANYTNEIGELIQQAAGDSLITRKDNLWLVPSVSAVIGETTWNPDAVWATGIVTTYLQSLHSLSVERYPNNNCVAIYGGGTPVNPQDVLPNYLTHAGTLAVQGEYVSSANIAVQNNKPLMMFETNTASCSGFVGISDAFAAALWGVDWSLTLAAGNFSGALFHVGGQNAAYNPFTPPPGNQSHFRQWTIGPIYYAALVLAEAMGPSNKSQVVDLNQNPSTPAWAIYESGTPTKVAVINYLDDPSGNSTISVSIAVGGGQTGQNGATPSQVKVKRLSAESVVQKGNLTWAGQTLGNNFQSDGRLMGEPQEDTVQCSNNVCVVTVPAPGMALVFLTDDAFNAVTPNPAKTVTFPTTFATATVNTAKIDPSAIANSNGHGNLAGMQFTTSPGSRSAAARTPLPGLSALLAAVATGVIALYRRWV